MRLAFRVARTSHPRYNHFIPLANYFRRILELRRLTRQRITPAQILPYEEVSLVFATASRRSRRSLTPSPEPIPIPPRHASSPELEEGEIPRSPSPSSYFTAAERRPSRESSVASASLVDSEGALSEADTVDVVQIQRDDVEITEEQIEVAGWAHLQQRIINNIVESIHTNPAFFDVLVARFPDQNEIFGTSVEAWRGLHLVCRRVEQRQRERLAAEVDAEIAREDDDDTGGWEEYIRTGGNPPPNPNNRLLHTPPPGSPVDSIRTNITYRNDADGRLITNTYVVSAEDIQDEHYVAYD